METCHSLYSHTCVVLLAISHSLKNSSQATVKVKGVGNWSRPIPLEFLPQYRHSNKGVTCLTSLRVRFLTKQIVRRNQHWLSLVLQASDEEHYLETIERVGALV
jgi:hypothetical protein